MTGSALDPAVAFNRAIAAYKAGQLSEAEQICQQIISGFPDHFDATHVLAVVQAAQRKNELALATYDRALVLRPDHADVLNNRGNTQLALNRFHDALESYDRALALRKDYPEAHSNRGSVLERLNRLDEALASYDRAVALRPNFVEALYNRGNTLKALKRFEDALVSYDRALALQPKHADAHNNRGQVLKELMRYDEALKSYDSAIAVQPEHVMAHCNAAALRLLTGDFNRGWIDYEWRWLKESVISTYRSFSQPIWRGDASISGKTVLVHSEQGLGDTIQFSRYVPMVAAAGARVVFEVQKPLQGLMANLAPSVEIVGRGDPLPPFDMHCPLLTLPLAFGTRLETIPSAKSYLQAPASHLAKWQTRLADVARPLIGLVWSGNPRHDRDVERSIPFRSLVPLFDARVTFISLQKELRAGDLPILMEHPAVLNLGEGLTDFSDTAGLVSEIDLVISVDTSVAHLAAALGRPTWILLTYVPDWRWMLSRDDSPWYPTVRLFRQGASHNWDGVIAELHQAIEKIADLGRS